MVLKRVHRPRSCSYQLLLEHQRPSRIQGLRWVTWEDSEESLDFSVSLEQASAERVLRAGKQLHRHLLATCPTLIRDRKYHLRLYRQCCSGRELVDGILALGLGVHSRSQAVGICQVLLDEGALCHVKHDWTFQDRDTQFYRFPGSEPEPVGIHELEDELVEAVALLSQRGPDALLTVALRKPPGQRTDEELDLIFEELLHIKAVAHLSNSVSPTAGQGDKGTSWYIIWKGSVNVVTHGKGLVTTLHEGDDFGQLALVNDAPRAATIILREDNCHFLRVDKQDFNRIIKDVEAKTMRLEEHGKVVLVLERASQGAGPSRPPTPGRNRYTVMSGTPEKILELLLEAMRPDSSAHDPTETFLSDFLLTYSVFMPSAQLCAALLHQYPSRGSEQEHSTYICNRRQQILRLVGQWVALYGPMLHTDPVATSFLQKLSDLVSRDTRLCILLREQWPERRRHHRLENGCGNASPQMKARNMAVWLPGQDQPLPSSNCAIRVGDKVSYDICRPDHSVLTLKLPVTASVREVMAALAQEDGWTKGQVLVKVNSAGDAIGLQPEARALFHLQTPHPEQLGPTVGSAEGLDLVSAKDLAGQLTDHDWNLFNSIHQVELIHYVLGRPAVVWVGALGVWLFPLRSSGSSAHSLKEQKNLNSFFAVMFGLSNSAISRLAHTWEVGAMWRDPSWNHRVYRLALTKLSPPIIPFMPLLLKDMTFIHEGNHTLVENLINFEKMRMMARVRSRVSHLHEDSQAARTSTCSEQSLSTRSPASTWAYVQQLKVIDNQRELSRLSRELEP
uniref:Rap guanine nucleotide exchange factor 3 n=1 Tax=Ursus maritimus TaxID=29073 RepID=A0A452SYF4_URSMA